MTSAGTRSPAQLTQDDFEAIIYRLDTILWQGQDDLREAYKTAHERLVAAVSDPALAACARLLLQAPFALRCRHIVAELRALRSQQGLWLPEERRNHDQALRGACGYHHQLTFFNNRYRSVVGSRTALTQWLIQASSYSHRWDESYRKDWALGVMAGSVGEVVGADLLRQLVRGLRHSTVEADVTRHRDFKFRPTPRGVWSADIKTGRSCLEKAVVCRGSHHIILSIRSGDIVGFYLKPEREAFYLEALREVL